MQPAKQIWHNGVIETMNPAAPRAEAMAVTAGRVTAVGRDSEVMNLAGPGTRIADLKGLFVMPGLVESHTHALWGPAAICSTCTADTRPGWTRFWTRCGRGRRSCRRGRRCSAARGGTTCAPAWVRRRAGFWMRSPPRIR